MMLLSPLSAPCIATAPFPHALLLLGTPPPPNPTLESVYSQLSSLSPSIPILALPWLELSLTTLNPSLPHFCCNDAWEPISDFHVSRPSWVAQYCPSAISEYNELVCLFITINLICWSIIIPRQSLEKEVFQ